MKAKYISYFIVLAFLLLISPNALGRSMIKGTVLDEETGKPIEGAAVFIHWSKIKTTLIFPSSYEDVEIWETLTNSEGEFQIPKYSNWLKGKEYNMCIYKKGYVCWNNEYIFPDYVNREDFILKKKMKIELEPFKDAYSKEEHASFTVSCSVRRKRPGLFDDAIKSEKKLIVI